VTTELPVHAPRPPPAAPGLQPVGDQGATLAIPVRDGETVVGALLASGPRLGEGELRLLAGLADAAGSLLGRARARAALEEAEARAERAKAVAVEREGMATLGHVAACVTHEIASPLACLGSNLRAAQESVMELLALARAGGDAARAQEIAAELLEMLSDSGSDVSRVATLVQSMRGLSHRRADDKLRFDPRGPVEDAVRIFRGARHFEVRLEIQPELPYVHGSPALLCQLVLNLLDNGLYAMSGTGQLAVWLGRGPSGAAVLEVEDQGNGIPPEVAGRVFEPYFTTKPPGQGTGLGLYICKDVVERMGGHVGFRTSPEGTCFRVEIPPAP
jgi:signal transduction histidine kinase